MKLTPNTMTSIKRGALIVLEGVDRSGKSTQAKQLVYSLRKHNKRSEVISFPDRSTATGKIIAEYLTNATLKLHDNAIHLLFTVNRWEKFEQMQQLLSDGVTVIVDRYTYSGVAYSAAKSTGTDVNWFKYPESGLIKPDRVFLLTLTDEAMVKRPGFGTERYETVGIQQKVSDIYNSFKDKSWKTVDASESFENVHNTLLNDILQRIEDVQDLKIEYLDFIKKQ